jgi:hypothetical protein
MQGPDANTYWTADTGQTVTSVGTATISGGTGKIGDTALWLDGNSDYVTVPDSTDWAFGTGDFTVECWVYYNGTADHVHFSQRADASNYWYMDYDTGKWKMAFVSGGTTQGQYEVSDTLSTGQWYHVAWCRSSSTGLIFIDGVNQSLTELTAFSTNDVGDIGSVLTIGSYNGGSFVNGYMDGIRITKGTCLYTADFTPPTTIDDYVGTSAITIFGLEGDTDEQYMLDLMFKSSASVVKCNVRLNGDAGAAIYGCQDLLGDNATIQANRFTDSAIPIGNAGTDGYVSGGKMLLHAKSGYVRTALISENVSVTGTTITQVKAKGYSWNNTADEITSISLSPSSTGSFGVGSNFSLYRRITA